MSGSGIAGDRLRSFVERIERLEEEIKGLTDDKKDIYAEAKGEGFDVKSSVKSSASGSRTRRNETSGNRSSTYISTPSRPRRCRWLRRLSRSCA